MSKANLYYFMSIANLYYFMYVCTCDMLYFWKGSRLFMYSCPILRYLEI